MQTMIEFFAQGGYAGYVWSAYGMTLLVLAIETIGLLRGRRALLTRLARLARLRAAGERL